VPAFFILCVRNSAGIVILKHPKDKFNIVNYNVTFTLLTYFSLLCATTVDFPKPLRIQWTWW